MHFHLPKPLHGWRQFAGEVGIIVLGVLIALGAQQLVERLRDQQAAARASTAIKWELARQRLDAIERIAVQPCLTGQLNRLAVKLAAFKGGDWTGMPMTVAQTRIDTAQRTIPPAYRAPERLWVSEAWQTARSNGSINYLPETTVGAFARSYNRGDQILLLQTQENEAAAELAPLAVDGPLGTQDRASLLGAVAKVDHANAVMVYQAKALEAELGPLLRDLPEKEIDRETAEMLSLQRKFRGNCVLQLKMTGERERG